MLLVSRKLQAVWSASYSWTPYS